MILNDILFVVSGGQTIELYVSPHSESKLKNIKVLCFEAKKLNEYLNLKVFNIYTEVENVIKIVLV